MWSPKQIKISKPDCLAATRLCNDPHQKDNNLNYNGISGCKKKNVF